MERWKSSPHESIPALAIETVGQMTDEEKREAIASTWEAYLQCVQQYGYNAPLCLALLQVWATLNACLGFDNFGVKLADAQLASAYSG